MTQLRTWSVKEAIAHLDEPFSMINVDVVGDIAVSVYRCEGQLDWHEHRTNDELFWVVDGIMRMETEQGEAYLRPNEVTVVPKAVAHRSGSEVEAYVILLRSVISANRRNGRHHIFVTEPEAGVPTVDLKERADEIDEPFTFRSVGLVEDSVLQVAWGEGTWPVDVPAPCDIFFYVLEGGGTIEASGHMVRLDPGEAVVVPRGSLYRLSTERDTRLVRVGWEDVMGGAT